MRTAPKTPAWQDRPEDACVAGPLCTGIARQARRWQAGFMCANEFYQSLVNGFARNLAVDQAHSTTSDEDYCSASSRFGLSE